MPERPRKPLFPNPFYVILLVSSTVFVVTALAFFVSPWVGLDSDGARKAVEPGAASKALAAWFDRHGAVALGVEFVVMFVSALLAMATDHWFSVKSRSGSGSP